MITIVQSISLYYLNHKLINLHTHTHGWQQLHKYCNIIWTFHTLLYSISFKFCHKVPWRWCKSCQTCMCQMCSRWCHKWRGQKILNLSTLRKHTVTLDMLYIHIQYHKLFGTQKYSTDFCYNFLTTVPYLGNPICTAYTLVKTDCCHLLSASIGFLDKNQSLSADPQNSLMKAKSINMSLDFVKRSQ